MLKLFEKFDLLTLKLEGNNVDLDMNLVSVIELEVSSYSGAIIRRQAEGSVCGCWRQSDVEM